jgi:amino acid permease
MDIGECAPRAVQADFHSSNYMVALGTILFTLGGASTFPTIQNDMRRPAQFGLAVNVANACTKINILKIRILRVKYLNIKYNIENPKN